GDINIAILGPILQDNDKISSRILFTEEIVALLPMNHPLAHRSTIKLRELQEELFVMFLEGYVLRDVIIEGCLQRGFHPTIYFEGRDMDAIKGLVSAVLGVTLIPEVTIVDSLLRTIVQARVVEPDLHRSVGAVISKDRALL